MTVQDTASHDAADLEALSTASDSEALQRIMDTARAGAVAQAELEAQGIDPESEEGPEHPESEEADDEQESPEAEHPDESAAATDQEPTDERSPDEQQQPETRSERRQRALQKANADLEAERTRLRAAQGELHQIKASDASVIQAISQQAGSDQEFVQLRDMVRRTEEQQQRYEVMVQWRQVAGPIYRAAMDQAYSGLADAIKGATSFEGMPKDMGAQILQTSSPNQVLKLVYEAGQKVASKMLQAENQRLKAEVSSLKTRGVANGHQPASPDGTPSNGTSKLPPMLLADGSLNPEYEKLAASGKLYGVEKLTG